jgi:hypothetical protein
MSREHALFTLGCSSPQVDTTATKRLNHCAARVIVLMTSHLLLDILACPSALFLFFISFMTFLYRAKPWCISLMFYLSSPFFPNSFTRSLLH